MNQPSQHGRQYPPFRPTLKGCVGRDPALARMLKPCYLDALYAVAAYTYRALLCEREDAALSELFDEIAVDGAEHFRLLGDLILALGGDASIRAQMRVDTPQGREESGGVQMLAQALQEERGRVDRYQTLMGRTQDRIVRSVLSHLLADVQHHISRLHEIQ